MNDTYKSGFVAIIGRPNVGKSTLMNQLIGQKIAITSSKAQTTRNRIQTVYTSDEGQIVFLDTPGINRAKNKLGEYMLKVAEGTLNEVDVVMWIVEATTFIGAGERYIIEQLERVKTPIIIVVNKIDAVSEEEVFKAISTYKDACSHAEIVPVSALKGKNKDELIKTLFKYLPYGPQFYSILSENIISGITECINAAKDLPVCRHYPASSLEGFMNQYGAMVYRMLSLSEITTSK